MISRTNSLESISSMRREYNDEEMISRPPSVSSIRDNANVNFKIDKKDEKPNETSGNATQKAVLGKSQIPSTATTTTMSNAPLNAAQKAILAKKQAKKQVDPKKDETITSRFFKALIGQKPNDKEDTTQIAQHPIIEAVRAKFPNENLNPAEIAVITRRKGLTPIPPESKILNAAQKAVLANKNRKLQIPTTTTISTRPAQTGSAPLNAAQKAAKRQQKINNPPTVSLIASIEKKSTIKKKTAAAKADSKIKRDELVARWQNKSDDVEMAIPLQTGKRKKSLPKFNPTGDPKYKKEN